MGEKSVHQLHGQWVVRLLGPHPSFGDWKPKDDGYRWVPKSQTHPITKGLEWFVKGREPEYYQGYWSFSGKHLELKTIDGIKEFHRIRWNAATEILEIASDSPDLTHEKDLYLESRYVTPSHLAFQDTLENYGQVQWSTEEAISALRRFQDQWFDAEQTSKIVDDLPLRDKLIQLAVDELAPGDWGYSDFEGRGSCRLVADRAKTPGRFSVQRLSGKVREEIRPFFEFGASVGKILVQPQECLWQGPQQIFSVSMEGACVWVQRRRNFRIVIPESIRRFAWCDGQGVLLRDYSETGVQVKVGYPENEDFSPYAPGQKISKFRILVGQKILEMQAVVRWVSEGRMGLEWSTDNESSAKDYLVHRVAVEAAPTIQKLQSLLIFGSGI
jgi:hypothetical protein